MTDRILRAYYDLAIAPPSFDICVFLYAAEMERRFLGLDAFDLYVVANHGHGFRNDLIFQTLDDNIWRLNHIVLPAHRLVPACRRAVFLADRTEALKEFDPSHPIFPPTYTVDAPVAQYLDSDVLLSRYADRPTATLRAPRPALDRVGLWLKQQSQQRKAVTITLRHDAFQPQRNSNIAEWVRFIRWLDPQKYQPILVRDTADLFHPPDPALQECLLFDPAAQDLELRLALYELAYINLFVDSGPAICCMLDEKTRCIRFKLDPSNNPHAGLVSYLRRGYRTGMEWVGTNSHQLSVWKDDTADQIQEHFLLLEDRIKSGQKPTLNPLPPPATVASNFIVGGNPEGAITLATLALQKNPNDLELRFLRGMAQLRSRNFEAAEREFRSLFYEFPQTQETTLIPFSNSLWKSGQTSAAIKLLLEAAARHVDRPDLLIPIADALLNMGETTMGSQLVDTLRRATPNNSDLPILHAKFLMNENLAAHDALVLLDEAVRLQPRVSRIHQMLADCYSRTANFEKAILHAQTAMVLDGETSIATLVNIGRWSKFIGNEAQASAVLEQAYSGTEQKTDPKVENPREIVNWLSVKAHIAVLLGRIDDAHSCYERIVDIWGAQEIGKLDPEFYLPDTMARLQRLRRIIDGRDVFIFCHGPSIRSLDEKWKAFAKSNACLMAINRFSVFTSGFLKQTQSQIDVAMVTHFNPFRQMIDLILDFLSSDSENLLITSRWVTDRIGIAGPGSRYLEGLFDEKLLYFGRPRQIQPATPYDPLRFISGNTLTLMILFSVIGKARRIFLFGADGGAPADSQTSTHYGAERAEFRYEISERDRARIANVLAADALGFADNVETGLIAAEHLFNVPRPPIYNVSPDSAIGCFPRITYEEALRILAGDRQEAASFPAAVAG